jgi:hypothetical protein
MLSLIICSVHPRLLADIRQNIAVSIGVPYELLVWDNREAKLGLCAAYNKMAATARYEHLLFLHEDLVFETHHWGKILMDIFQSDAAPKMIGVAGGRYKGRTYSGWFSGITGADFYHIFHQHGGKKQNNSNHQAWRSPEVPVCCIDGVFMAVTRNVWREIMFDDRLLTGFHFYDLDFSLRVSAQYPVVVTNRIDIIHLTQGGDYGDRWLEQAFIFHKAWKIKLPMYLDGAANLKETEIKTAATWLHRLKTEPIKMNNRLAWISQQKLHKHPTLWAAIVAFVGYRATGLHRIFLLLKKSKQALIKQ